MAEKYSIVTMDNGHYGLLQWGDNNMSYIWVFKTREILYDLIGAIREGQKRDII